MCFSIRQALFKVLFTRLKSVINKKQQKKNIPFILFSCQSLFLINRSGILSILILFIVEIRKSRNVLF